jgi:hypothetical protein
MLEIRRGSTAVRSYENTFFREFSKNLNTLFDEYSIDGLLIGNSECEISESLKIDCLLITTNAILLIDFKNYGGDIILPKSDSDFSEGKWVTRNEDVVKGGSHINPYKQLFQQKKAFTWVFYNSEIESVILKNNEKLNPSHVKKVVCFQRPVSLIGHIPGRDEIDFFITDSAGYLETIKDILDVTDEDVDLSRNSFDIFKDVFRAEKFLMLENYNQSKLIEKAPSKLNYGELYLDQKSALQEVVEFIKSDVEKIFILQGTSLSGKSHLMPFIEDIAFDNGITQVDFFAPSGRVSLNLLSDLDIEFSSIYSHIYGGVPLKEVVKLFDNKGDQIDFIKDSDGVFFDLNGDQIDLSDYVKTYLDVMPLKKNDSEDRAVFIVDVAQLVSNSYFQSIDMRFGSGFLLKDFIDYTNLNESNRKIIFIGDGFQLSSTSDKDNALNADYFREKYKFETSVFELLDKNDISPIVNQALLAVNGIRLEKYNRLSFDFSQEFQSISKNEVSHLVEDKIRNNIDFHILSYTNFDVQKINLWIKNSILNNGSDIAKDDLIIFNNNFRIENMNDPFGEPNRIFNGEFAVVQSASNNVISEAVILKGHAPIILKYRPLSLVLNNTQQKIEILSLENFRLSDKGELSEKETVAIKVALDREISKEIEKNPFVNSDLNIQLINSSEYVKIFKEVSVLEFELNNGERVKTKLKEKEGQLKKLIKLAKQTHRKNVENFLLRDSSSKYYKYKNAAHIKFGWSLTVHKSVSYKWSDVIFDVNPERLGKTNKQYFKLIYTGLTRAKNNVCLINYVPITPLLKIEFKDNPKVNQKAKNIYFIADKDAEVSLSSASIVKDFNFPDVELTPILIQIFYFIYSKLETKGIDVESILHQDYHEVYTLVDNSKKSVKISIYYNKKGHVRIPILLKAESEELGERVISTLKEDQGIVNFDFINDEWRREIYIDVSLLLKDDGYKILNIIQTSYKDTINISKGDSSLTVDMNYDGNGLFTSIISISYTQPMIWDNYKTILKKIAKSNATYA